MTDVRDTKVVSPIDQMPVRIWRATFAEDIDDETDEAQLILPDFDPNLTWGPANWRAVPHDSLPQAGDEALVVFDNAMQPWVATWWSGRPWAPQMGDWPGSYPIVNADIAAGAAISWTKISKTGSSLADLATRSATDLTSGTLPAARLPVFAASGASHAVGAVPDPGAVGGATRYLREDATWAVPPGGGGGSTPDPLALNFDITARNTLATQTKIGAVGPSGQAGIVFGSASDVSLYRVSSTLVRTDNSFSVGGVYQIDPSPGSPTAAIQRFGDGSGWVLRWRTTAGSADIMSLRDTGDLTLAASVTATNISASNSLLVNQSDLTPNNGQGAIFFGGSWDTHLSRRTGGVISPWLFSNRAINAPDAVLGGPKQDIRWFGAVPGATTTAQYNANQTAIQNAFNAAGAVGGTVFVPYGLWKYTGPVVSPSNIRVEGVKGKATDQAHGSILTQTGGGNLLDMSGCVDVEFENVHLFNQGTNGIYTSGTDYAVNITFEHVQFTNYGSGHMIWLNTATGQGNERWLWHDCIFTGGGVNQYFVASIGPEFFDKMNFTECVFEDFNGYAIYSDAIAVRSFRMAGCVTHGLFSSGCRGTLYMSGVVAGHGILIERQYTENASDRGTTAQITQQGDFVFQGSSIHPTFISGHLNSGGGSPAPVCTYAVNISGSGSNALYMVNASYAGAINDPSNIRKIL